MQKFFDWSHIPEHINPIVFSIGPVQIRWYGILYLTAFLLVYFLVIYRIKTEKLPYSKQYISYIFIVGILAAVIGGRLGYVIFYGFRYYLANPLKIFIPFETSGGLKYSGMYGLSYHGSVICMLLTGIYLSKKDKVNFWKMGDIIMPAVPFGYTLGRLGNFINGELYGRITTSSWGMYFPKDPTCSLRHPSQLYEAFFEGILLFLILWNLRKIKLFDGFIFLLYFIGYGVARFFIEYFREPDSQLGFVLGDFTMGQILSFCMVSFGIFTMLIRIMQTKKQSSST